LEEVDALGGAVLFREGVGGLREFFPLVELVGLVISPSDERARVEPMGDKQLVKRRMGLTSDMLSNLHPLPH